MILEYDMRPLSVKRVSTPNAIIVASYGTFSTGINIRRLKYLVLSASSKSRYRILQSVGRLLRKHASKSRVYVMDIIDDLSIKVKNTWYTNHALKQWTVRQEFYSEEHFPVEMYEHDLTHYERTVPRSTGPE